jgi:hypothetical protein
MGMVGPRLAVVSKRRRCGETQIASGLLGRAETGGKGGTHGL